LNNSGKLSPIVNRMLPLSEARRAQEFSQSGHTHGKIVLGVNEKTSGRTENNHDHDRDIGTDDLLIRFSGLAERSADRRSGQDDVSKADH